MKRNFLHGEKIVVDSIFRYEDDPQELSDFVNDALAHGCTVEFENEGYKFGEEFGCTPLVTLTGAIIFMEAGKDLLPARERFYKTVSPVDQA